MSTNNLKIPKNHDKIVTDRIRKSKGLHRRSKVRKSIRLKNVRKKNLSFHCLVEIKFYD